MTYVLIVTLWLGGYVSGYHVTTQEFSSLQNCEIARKVVINNTEDANRDQQAKTECVKK